MEKESKLGMNKTGFQMAPVEGPRTAEFASERPPHPLVDDGAAAGIRALYLKESTRVGSVPPPLTPKGMVTAAVDGVKGEPLSVLMDKLGQRAAFERSGVRLYQSLIGKVEVVQPPQVDDMLADLQHICDEELSHFLMLSEVIKDMGGDPTAQTPCADVSGVAALGLLQVITDPRTTVAQSLEAIQTAELTDNACWELLIDLAGQSGHDKLVGPFQQALTAEQEHLTMVNRWLRHCVIEQA